LGVDDGDVVRGRPGDDVVDDLDAVRGGAVVVDAARAADDGVLGDHRPGGGVTDVDAVLGGRVDDVADRAGVGVGEVNPARHAGHVVPQGGGACLEVDAVRPGDRGGEPDGVAGNHVALAANVDGGRARGVDVVAVDDVAAGVDTGLD